MDQFFQFYVAIVSFVIFDTAGCAFLKYETKEQALAAIESLNGKYRMEVCFFSTLEFLR